MARLDDLTPAMFHRKDGTFHAGVEFKYKGEPESSTYQFANLVELVECAKAFELQPMEWYRLVTFNPGYTSKKTRYKWEATSHA